jgi:hypothetical protein
MAETAPPRLPSSSAADVNYAPYAVLAVIALVVSVLFAVMLGILAVMAFVSHQPFIEPLVLVLPVAAVVLAYAARRQIQNSEGTRAGMPLVNTAWWVALVGGMGYAAYMVSYQIGVREDAKNSFTAWAKHLDQIDVNDPRNPDFFYVFEGSLEPEKQGKVKVGQADMMYKQLKPQVASARQSFLVRLGNRNRSQLQFDVGGLDNWVQDASGQKGALKVTVKSPEGETTCSIPMVAKRIDGQWRWQIPLSPTGNIITVRVTPYGQYVADIIASGYAMVQDGLIPALFTRTENPAVFKLFADPSKPYPVKGWADSQAFSRAAVLGTAGSYHPVPPDYDTLINRFFEPAEKGDPVREAEQRRNFVQFWRFGRMMPSGRIVPNNPDQQPILSFLKDAVELRVPVELQTPAMESTAAAARGAVVLRCDDPKTLAKLDDLRRSAATDRLENMAQPTVGWSTIPWRLQFIESDMKILATAREVGPNAGSP